LRGDLGSHGGERVAMEDQLVGELDQHAIAQQQSHKFLRANFVHRQRSQDFFEQRDF